MTHLERYTFIDRVQMVLDNLRHCNSACEVHEVGNMRNTATLLIDALIFYRHNDSFEVKDMVERLEKKQLDFFKRKFGVIT